MAVPICTYMTIAERTGSLAADIVRWVILTDQWPYRTSYILQVIEDASQRYNAGLLDERIPDYWTILEIWEYVSCFSAIVYRQFIMSTAHWSVL